MTQRVTLRVTWTTLRVAIPFIVLAALIVSAGCTVVGAQEQTAESRNKYSPLGYEALYTHGTLHEIEIVMTQSEWDALLREMHIYAAEDPSGKPLTGKYFRATFVYHGTAGDAVIEDVGFRVKGNYSRPYPEDQFGDFKQAHFKIKFNKSFDEIEGTAAYEEREERRFAKQRELELRMHLYNGDTGVWDTTQIRELYGYELMRLAGTNTSRTGSTQLTLTVGGVKHDFGIYTLIEQVDKSFLTKRYGSAANDGNLYKNHWGDSGPANLGPIDDPNNFRHPFAGNPRIIGVKDMAAHYRPTYDLQRNTENPDYSDLLDFIRNLNTLEGRDFVDYMEANFEVDKFIRYLAMNFLLGKWDDYWSIGNNYYLYFNNDGKIEFYSVDYDMAFGDGWALFDTANVGLYEWGNRNRDLLRILAPQITEEELSGADWEYPLADKILAIGDYRRLYEAYLEEFINPANGLFLYSKFEEKFNLMYPVFQPHLDNEMNVGEEMYINDRVKRYYYDKTRSVIAQLGLNEADYEIPPFADLPIGMPAPASALAGAATSGVTITTVTNTLPDSRDWLWNEANGHYYMLTDAMNWHEAEAQAVAWGGNLVTVNDEEEESWLREQFGARQFWLGMNDSATEGDWEWASGEPVNYTNWGGNEPNDFGDGEDVAVTNWSSQNPTRGWNDIAASRSLVGVVEATEIPDAAATTAGTDDQPAPTTIAQPAAPRAPSSGVSLTQEVTSDLYGFSFLMPDGWAEQAGPSLFEAVAPSEVSGVFVSAWQSGWGSRLAEVLPLAFPQDSVEIISVGEIVTTDGTTATVVEHRAKVAGWNMHLYTVGAIRGNWWLAVNIWNIDQYADYNGALFRDIAATVGYFNP